MTASPRQERAREDILEAAAEAIAVHGFHGMSMRKLATATGRSLANFYNYFDSKYDVLFALHTRAFETLIETGHALLARTADPAGRLYLFVASHVTYFLEHPAVMRVLVQSASALAPHQRHAVRQLKDRYFDIARQVVDEIVENRPPAPQSVHRQLGADELEQATYNIFGMLNWVYAWYDPERHGTARDLTRTIHRMALGALAWYSPTESLQDDMDRLFAEITLPSLIRVEHGDTE